MLTYDDSTHVYADGETRIPSVTQVLSSYFQVDASRFAYGSAERGRAVHAFCAAYAQGERRIWPVSPNLKPYCDAFKQWLFDSGARVLEVEQIIDSILFGRRYAGRFDLLVLLDGRRVLVDLKTGATADYYPAQVAAYSLAIEPAPARTMILYLKQDGTYKPDYQTSAQLAGGCRTFAAALAAWREE